MTSLHYSPHRLDVGRALHALSYDLAKMETTKKGGIASFDNFINCCLPRHPFVLSFFVASSLVLFCILLLCFVDELVRALSLISNPL
jgi:hypothetical protein